ncbi:MAG: GNAT family N-acetyltransferase [Oscillospiraceae bacterium]|nr:GNAT family N-acetyltransferase [Oscillospiraceae bacterium]
MNVTIRKFERSDIPNKVKWINDPANNRYLHYDLPLSVEKTEKWFDSHFGETTRYDAVIEVDGKAVGLIGLLAVDQKNRKAEYYISLGDTAYKGKGVAKEATRKLLRFAFEELGLNRVYLFTEVDNLSAQKLFEAVGFQREGILQQDIFSRGVYVNRIAYGFLKEDWRE